MVVRARDSEKDYIMNNRGTTIFYLLKASSEAYCFKCDSEVIFTKRPISSNCAELTDIQEGTINYPHCPKCKPEIPERFYGFFGDWPGI